MRRHDGEWLLGRHAVEAAMAAGRRRVHDLWVREGSDLGTSEALQRLAATSGVSIRRVDAEQIQDQFGEPVPIAARCSGYPYRGESELPPAAGAASLVAVLDGIQDPQNLGAIARSAGAAGARALLIPRRRAAQVTPAVVRASAGASEYLAIHRVTNVVRSLERLQALGYWTVGLAPEATQPWFDPDYRGGVALVVGGEGSGLRRLVAERCDHLVSLPMRGRVESLNASAAFAAVAFEVVRQQMAD